MSAWMILTVTLLYAITGILQIRDGNFAVAIFLIGCSIANIGVMMMTMEKAA